MRRIFNHCVECGLGQALPKRLVGFVFQEDLMLANLTVAETLMVVARLRLPQRAEGVRQNTVDALLSELGIAHCADSIVRGLPPTALSNPQPER
jgi:ABC-type multidrug transport system ATPase subunit